MSDELTMVVMLAITAGTALFVAWPLMFGCRRPEEFLGPEPGKPVLRRLLFQRDSVYEAVKELEFDLAMGKLSRQDFEQLHERYRRKAVAILKRIDDAKACRLSPDETLDEEGESGVEPPFQPRQQEQASSEPRVDLDVEAEIEAFRRRSKHARRQDKMGGE